MTYEFDHGNDPDEQDHDPENECIVYVEGDSMTGGISYNAECSECGAEIPIMAAPTECGGCDRKIVDVEGPY